MKESSQVFIAIDHNDFLIYQGHAPGYAYGLWPIPMVSAATLLDGAPNLSLLPAGGSLASAELVFREDSFDAIARIKRGRLYRVMPTRPTTWNVSPPSVQPFAVQAQRQLYGFDSNTVGELSAYVGSGLVALGTASAFSLWKLVSLERIYSGEDVVTLKARGSLGVLPEVNEDKVPAEAREKLRQAIETLQDAAHRSGPESVIDRARDVTQWCLGSWLSHLRSEPQLREQDIKALVSKMEGTSFPVIRGVAHSIARLHARNKPNEQVKHGSRPIMEADAEYALAGVGILLRELGWAT